MGKIYYGNIEYAGGTGGGSSISIITKTGTDTVIGGQFIVIDNVETLIKGTGYMEKTQIMSTSTNNVFTFTNSAITADSSIDPYASIYDLYPIDIQVSAGQCQVTFEPLSSASEMSCKIYIK